ncbi:MAG: Bug family tripartite tricarboxylate transporter substrate binding protein [Parvibaculaceae bacterium]
MAHAAENFFAGKTITYIVATKPGGGYDTMGRLVAKYLEAHIPDAQIVVKNIAGAGHLVGCQTIYNAAPDGLTIGTFNTSLIYSQLTGALDSDLDLRRMSWIGKAAIESRVIVVAARSGITSVDALKQTDRVFNVAVTGKGAASHVDAMLLARVFGYNFRPIFGFEGTEAELSMLRGEIDVQVASRSSLEPFVASGGGRFLLEFGGAPDSTLPQGDALAKSPTDRAVIDLIEAQAKFTRVTAGPPGIPPDRLQFLRSAYLAIFSDSGFLAEAKALQLPISPASGEAVAGRITAALDPSPEIHAILADLLK